MLQCGNSGNYLTINDNGKLECKNDKSINGNSIFMFCELQRECRIVM